MPEGSVIYCDIPYKDTNVYNKGEDFDYPRFYHWAMTQSCPVFISSYWMPERFFECVDEVTHQSIYCATKVLNVTERIFVPRKDVEPYPYVEELSLDLDFPDE